MLDNEAIELEFVSVLLYYTYIKESKREESMMCRNDKSRVGPKWKTQQLAIGQSRLGVHGTYGLINPRNHPRKCQAGLEILVDLPM